MNKITLENFRCFRGKHEARLAPLTLLVGENSTGKTSFLALIRALWDVAFEQTVPNFKWMPFDLGTFDEIAYTSEKQDDQVTKFEAGFDFASPQREETKEDFRFQVVFQQIGTAPFPVERRLARGLIWLEDRPIEPDAGVWFGVSKGQRKKASSPFRLDNRDRLDPFEMLALNLRRMDDKSAEKYNAAFRPFVKDFMVVKNRRIYAGAPVRSKPRRTYDPARPTLDPEGIGVPMYLAEMHFRGGDKWNELKNALEEFGRRSGLFDKITVKRYGKYQSEPFQLQVKKTGGKSKGPWRNLIDVGYGVSQVLPVITELLSPYVPNISLIQQPEVHLHPSAQAALGSFFCERAGPGRQLVVETHSDYLLDRVRMDVRDGNSNLKPEDVSILFFERGDLDVCIHSLALDNDGQVIDAPAGYRKFFMEEMNRRLKI